MRVRILLMTCTLCWTAPLVAQDAPPPAPTPDLTAVRLLDEVPDYPAILGSQWRTGVVLGADEVGRAGAHFGRLVESGPVQTLSLHESIALALQNNTGLQIERLNPVAATAAVRKARSVFDPQFFGNVQKVRRQSLADTISPFTTASGETEGNGTPPERTRASKFEQDIEFDAGLRKVLLSGGQLSLEWSNDRISSDPTIVNQLVPKYELTLGLSLNQPLLRGFGWRYALLQVDVAETTEEQAYHAYQASIATLVSQVEAAYWGLVLAIQNVQVEEQGLDLARELLRQNEGRFKVGALPRTAVLEAQAEVARREAKLVGSRNQRVIARDNLRALINSRQAEAGAVLMVEPADEPTVIPYEIDIERSLQTALEQRPELLAARLDVENKQLQRKIAENALLPRVDLVGSFGLKGVGGRDAGVKAPVGFGDFKPNPQVLGGFDRSLELLTDGRLYEYVAGAQVEVPIANAAAKAGYVQAKVDTERAWLSLHQLEENVTLEIKQAVSNLEADRTAIDANRIARELAEENVRNQKARYDVGLATTKDLLDFQDRLTQARAAEIDGLIRYNTNLAELHRAEGTLLRERNILVERRGREAAPWWARF